MLLRAKIRMGESDLTAFETRLFTDGTLQRTSSSPTLAQDTSHASVSSCSSRSKKSSRSEGQRHKPAVKQWVHYPGHSYSCFMVLLIQTEGLRRASIWGREWQFVHYTAVEVQVLHSARAVLEDVIKGEDRSWVWLFASLPHESMF